jgi:NAD+ synthase (glutamine-hydrolysing)
MKILAAQINPTVGDLIGNRKKIVEAIKNGCQNQADIVLFPELALTGYPPEDLLLLPHFIASTAEQLEEIIAATKGIIAIVGLPRPNPHGLEKKLFNSAAIIQDGKLLCYADKILLPTYDIFDERRYFEPGNHVCILNIKGKKIGITICEDLWQHSGFVELTKYRRDPILELKDSKPDLVLNLSASPFSHSKYNKRFKVCQKIAKTLDCPILLCNQVGANDSVIFDGYSLYTTPDGMQQAAIGFKEEEMWVDTDSKEKGHIKKRDEWQDLYQALALGVHDYFKKIGFKKACLGLSGGIDSALVACIAVEALGAQNVCALFMPSRFSSLESRRDAELLAKNLEIEFHVISIEEPFESYLKLLTPQFKGLPADATEENLQARIRGMILMAFSNKFGHIVLSTGNKSEMAMGYATLYGDMCGGLGVINDVTKGQVNNLSKWINRESEIIPWHTITRAPSAELRPDQKDSDTLPEYEILDNVMQAYIEEHCSAQQISDQFGYSLELVEDLIRRIHQNEYKRRQAPPGLRVSEKAFSVGRRFPIVQKWVAGP